MRFSSSYIPFLKSVAKEGGSESSQLLLRAGMVRQCVSGIYTWLPLGLRVLRKIEGIIREIMDENGVNEVLMPCLQNADLWKESGRYESYGKEMLRFFDRGKRELLFGPTDEELITDLLRTEVKGYKNLPIRLNNIQWKFRDELRPKGGLIRAREFFMSDAYSFDLDVESAEASYYLFYKIYLEIFRKMGIKVLPVKAVSGAIGGKLSHEFTLICENGENDVLYEPSCIPLIDSYYKTGDAEFLKDLRSKRALSADLLQEGNGDQGLSKAKGIELGHIFYFGTKYSAPMGARVQNAQGKMVDIHMGSYGIGVSRLVAAVVECFHDSKGIKWPVNLAPVRCGLVLLNGGDREVAEFLYAFLGKHFDVLYDDLPDSNGAKFAKMDLIGVPFQLILGANATKERVELRSRNSGSSSFYPVEQLVSVISRDSD